MAYGMFPGPAAVTDLPHGPISVAIFLITESAICAAWEILRATPRGNFNLRTATEDQITHELYEVLYDHVFDSGMIPGFSRDLFTVVTRESKLRNYDGTKLDKMPDMLVGLVDRVNVYKPSQDWIFIECKPVDPNHATGVHYCNKGIARFVSGEYAWAMSSALMIGYARNDYTISEKLNEALLKQTEMATLRFPDACCFSRATSSSEVVHMTEHERYFTYVENGRKAPPIMLRHLWLRRN